MAEGGLLTPVIDVSSAAVTAGQNSFTGAEHLTGTLTLGDLNNFGFGNLQYQSVGSKGYAIYDPGGSATSLINLPTPITHTFGSGWWDVAGLVREYRVDNTLYNNNGMITSPSSPVCAIYLGAGDTNYHVMTVVSPAQYDNQSAVSNPRAFTMRLTSTNGTSAAFTVNEPHGYSHTFQFIFKSDVSLWADATDGGGAILQAIFLDDVPVISAPPSGPLNPPNDVSLRVSGTDLLFSGTNGIHGKTNVTFSVLTTTNLARPLNQWTPVATNAVDVSGIFSFTLTNALDPAALARYYILKPQ